MPAAKYYRAIPLEEQKSRGPKPRVFDTGLMRQIHYDSDYGLGVTSLARKYNISVYCVKKILETEIANDPPIDENVSE
jgi:hypothetical protein